MIDEEELIQENIRNLDPADIPIVSYFGSGSSLLGSILIKIGMDYIEGYQERVVAGEKQTEIVNPFWRNHWTILDQKYDGTPHKHLRFFKAHHYPESFEKSRISKAILLVRDGRDAALSYYNWRVGFVNDPRSFDEFLKTDSYFKRKPFHDWALFCDEWTEWGKTRPLHIMTFEDLKFNGFQTMKKLLDFVGIDCPDEDIQNALSQTSFQTMRKQEDQNSALDQPSRIFRKGLIGEWREAYTVDQLAFIPDDADHWLNVFGYNDPKGKIPAYDLTIITKDKHLSLIEGMLGTTCNNLNTKLLGGEFHVRDLAINMGKTTINYTDHFEIIRSVDLVCRMHDLNHLVVCEGPDSLADIKRLIDSL